MTDTPIYDQVRQELRERPEPGKPSRSAETSTGVSVWALIDKSQRGGSHRR
ncbi:MAG TPA: hypothetical protein VM677_20045 [Actinokineospora sp.]|nr:hypothetical protein [Actinokineospora sp.]